MADQMPPQRQAAGGQDLGLPFLHLVLAEIDLAGSSGRADGVDGKCLGDGDEANRGGKAAGPAGGVRDALADAVQPAGDIRR